MSKMAEPGSWFKDSRGEPFRITVLCAELAKPHRQWLVKTHNEIPFQHWTEEELFAASDGTRAYLGKWEISRIAFSSTGEPLAFCIGFEMQPDHQYYHQAGIYLHRLAVAPNVQGRMIGALLQAETIVQAFLRGLCFAGSVRAPVVIFGQTNITPSNYRVRLFHKAAGFREVGQKTYPDRTDVILRMGAAEFWSSRHLWQWRLARIPPPSSYTLGTKRREAGEEAGDAEAYVGPLPRAGETPQSLTIVDVVKGVVSRLTGIPSAEILDTDDLGELLAPDSLQMVEFWLALERGLRVELADEAIHELGSVAAIAQYLARRVPGGRKT